jgi:hypothetical protein
MSSSTQTAATLDDLYRVEGKAELIDGRIVPLMVVWDVDPIEDRILKYRSDAPEQPETFIRGQVANAEPAVPSWTIPVDVVFA